MFRVRASVNARTRVRFSVVVRFRPGAKAILLYLN